MLAAISDPSFVARFHARIDQRGPDECWPWVGSIDHRHGYGRMPAGVASRYLKAHRVAFAIEHQRVPRECVCHTCDNRPCCNPAHLFEGSIADNIKDMDSKGRRGKTGPTSMGCAQRKLVPEQVREIRRRHAAGEKIIPLGEEFSVSFSAIWNIVVRRTWKNLD